MNTLALFIVASLAAFVTSTENMTLEVHDPSYYHCPFRLFDSGLPVSDENGDTLYCDEYGGAACPSWYFCNSGHADNRSVCCHILGP